MHFVCNNLSTSYDLIMPIKFYKSTYNIHRTNGGALSDIFLHFRRVTCKVQQVTIHGVYKEHLQ